MIGFFIAILTAADARASPADSDDAVARQMMAFASPTASPACTPAIIVVLYDQNDNAGTNATVSQNFETANDTFDNQGADDFVVQAGQTWNVKQVKATGQYFSGPGPAVSFNVSIYSDASTLPGGLFASFTDVAYAEASGIFSMTLPTSVVLASGTYWLSVQANMDFTPAGEWGWMDGRCNLIRPPPGRIRAAALEPRARVGELERDCAPSTQEFPTSNSRSSARTASLMQHSRAER
jgi:hypothetical protein